MNQNSPESQSGPNRFGGWPFYLLLLLVVVIGAYALVNSAPPSKEDTLSDVIGYFSSGEVKAEDVSLEGNILRFSYNNAAARRAVQN